MDNYGLIIDMNEAIDENGDEIPRAVDLINSLVKAEIPFLLLVNSLQRTRLEITLKVQRMGFNVTVDHIYLCEMSTVKFISKLKGNPTAFITKAEYLINALNMSGINCSGKGSKFTVVDDVLPGYRSILVFSRCFAEVESSNDKFNPLKTVESFRSLDLGKVFSPREKPELILV
ncbi:MAG: hypothetical protein MK132_20170 [Lentisphaerales bacterium]|nr:hypothetical protein [Lentisphaerales bacterium]